MNNTTCKNDGSRRSANQKEECPKCHARTYWFNMYLTPEEARSYKCAAWILIAAILLVVIGLTAMYTILGNQLSTLAQPTMVSIY